MSREIQLSQGKVAVVDDQDYERLSQYKWSATKRVTKSGITWYAFRNTRGGDTATSYMHREILDAQTGILIDHRDRNGLNNTRSNLRVGDKVGNAANSRKRVGTTSKYKGVSWSKSANKWAAFIKCRDVHLSLGVYDTEEQAAEAYENAATELFGEFANAGC